MEGNSISSIERGLQSLILEEGHNQVALSAKPHLSTFPPELLLEIFYFLWEGDIYRLMHSSSGHALQLHMSMTVMPHSVSNVCAYWDTVCALEPKFWNTLSVVIGLAEDADPVTHCPSPASRLEKHLSRMTEASLGISIFLKSCPSFDNLKVYEQSEVFSRSYKAFKKRWPGAKEDQEAGERKVVGDLISVIRRHSGKLKVGRLEIGTFINTSLPAIQDFYEKDLLMQPNVEVVPALPWVFDFVNSLKIDAYWTPMDYATYPKLISPPLAPPSYANPCTQHLPTHTLFKHLHNLSLSGHTFVSFCRQYLSLFGDQTHICLGTAPEMVLKISTLRAEDGGSQYPFTMDELLTIIRLFCGRISHLSMDDVRLPLPSGVKMEEHSWVQCTGKPPPPEVNVFETPSGESVNPPPPVDDTFSRHILHLEHLSYVQLTHVNGPLVYGVEQLFKPHWDYARDTEASVHTFVPMVWWSVKEEDFDFLDAKTEHEQERIKADAKANYTIYDETIITSLTWKKKWKADLA